MPIVAHLCLCLLEHYAAHSGVCGCVAARERDTAEVGGAGRVSTEHCRDVQLTAAGGGSQNQETEEGKRNIVLCDVTVKLLAWTLRLTLSVLHIH